MVPRLRAAVDPGIRTNQPAWDVPDRNGGSDQFASPVSDVPSAARTSNSPVSPTAVAESGPTSTSFTFACGSYGFVRVVSVHETPTARIIAGIAPRRTFTRTRSEPVIGDL